MSGKEKLRLTIADRRGKLALCIGVIAIVLSIAFYLGGSAIANNYFDIESMQYYQLRGIQRWLMIAAPLVGLLIAFFISSYARRFACREKPILRDSGAVWQLMSRSIPLAPLDEVPEWSLCAQNTLLHRLELDGDISLATWFAQATVALAARRIQLKVPAHSEVNSRVGYPWQETVGILFLCSAVPLYLNQQAIGIPLFVLSTGPLIYILTWSMFDEYLRISLLLEEIARRLED